MEWELTSRRMKLVSLSIILFSCSPPPLLETKKTDVECFMLAVHFSFGGSGYCPFTIIEVSNILSAVNA